MYTTLEILHSSISSSELNDIWYTSYNTHHACPCMLGMSPERHVMENMEERVTMDLLLHGNFSKGLDQRDILDAFLYFKISD